MGVAAPMVPWLVILGLLALKPNRAWSAWWIWVPLAGVAAGWHGLQAAWGHAPQDVAANALALLSQVPLGLTFGLAALWLLAPWVVRGHRFRAFLASLTVLAAFVAFTGAAAAGLGAVVEPVASLLDPRHCAATARVGMASLPFVVPTVLPALGLAAALLLSGLACRGRMRSRRTSVWLGLSLLVVWVALSALAYGLYSLVSTEDLSYAPFFMVGLLLAAVTFATLVPFLILSVASPFFRERLKALLHVQPVELPPR